MARVAGAECTHTHTYTHIERTVKRWRVGGRVKGDITAQNVTKNCSGLVKPFRAPRARKVEPLEIRTLRGVVASSQVSSRLPLFCSEEKMGLPEW